MDKEKAFDELVDHLLGPDFYISSPVNGSQATEIEVNTIKSLYPGIKESPVYAYRRKHKKCKWCIYNKFIKPIGDCAPEYYKCIVKDKIVNEETPRPFCSVFSLKRDKDIEEIY